MFLQPLLVWGLYDHIIHINFDVPPNFVDEERINQSLVTYACVFQSEQHFLVAKDAMVCVKGGLFLVFLAHEDQVVAIVYV